MIELYRILLCELQAEREHKERDGVGELGALLSWKLRGGNVKLTWEALQVIVRGRDEWRIQADLGRRGWRNLGWVADAPWRVCRLNGDQRSMQDEAEYDGDGVVTR